MGISKDVLKAARPFPILGQVATLARARETLNEKGATFGSLDVALDLFPIVGRVKGLFELFGEELLTPENLKRIITTMRKALDELEAAVSAEASDSDRDSRTRSDHYPADSAKIAALRAKAAIKPVHEERSYECLSSLSS
ncbi:MAG: hypothetical protein KDD53_08330 [Bdellovibrionales bacterium]|nr:hypothetical protein [Bdellovibrionales bacterium]